MKAIISEGALIALCDEPRYVKLNAENGAYVVATEEEAEGMAVGGELYNLAGGTAIPDRPEAIVDEADAAEYVFQNRARIITNEESTGTAIVAVEEAMCEQDEATDERLTAVEEALCELDESLNI